MLVEELYDREIDKWTRFVERWNIGKSMIDNLYSLISISSLFFGFLEKKYISLKVCNIKQIHTYYYLRYLWNFVLKQLIDYIFTLSSIKPISSLIIVWFSIKKTNLKIYNIKQIHT